MSPAKYANRSDLSVYRPFLDRLYEEQSAKYKKDKDKIKAFKTKLHQAYGAYYSEKNIKAAKILIDGGGNLPQLSKQLTKLSVSSNERENFADEFYKYIFALIPFGAITSILDIGCGFNPFFLPCMKAANPNADIAAYYALDIGMDLISLANKYFALANLPGYARCMDLMAEIPGDLADLAFLFKIIPTLEACKKSRGFEILNNLNIKYAAVSFPTKTLCGKNINMAENYAEFFEKNINHDKFSVLGKNLFPGELVYVLVKNL
jgi:16S rRNA (guanine(1405)-N(7))-methyltransferase